MTCTPFRRPGLRQLSADQVLTNADLARKVDTSDEWIVQRTGIHERRIAAPGELTSHMASTRRGRRSRMRISMRKPST